ncbi:MAG: hypothetical protein QOF61_1532 [Acidobacteriota bacterium]|nr:hypothetical protein [Acidobacteriota bacterium]
MNTRLKSVFAAPVCARSRALSAKVANGNPCVTAQQHLTDTDAAINCINQLKIQSNGTGCF